MTHQVYFISFIKNFLNFPRFIVLQIKSLWIPILITIIIKKLENTQLKLTKANWSTRFNYVCLQENNIDKYVYNLTSSFNMWIVSKIIKNLKSNCTVVISLCLTGLVSIYDLDILKLLNQIQINIHFELNLYHFKN